MQKSTFIKKDYYTTGKDLENLGPKTYEIIISNYVYLFWGGTIKQKNK